MRRKRNVELLFYRENVFENSRLLSLPFPAGLIIATIHKTRARAIIRTYRLYQLKHYCSVTSSRRHQVTIQLL